MPATSQPTDQPTGKVLPDENALERLFRAQYASMLADAKSKLPNAEVSAPRVVSKAFHLAWIDRAKFKTPEELTVFLKASIQHGAARELSRRAGLHRVDHAVSGSTHGEGTHHVHHDVADMTVDQAWERLKQTLSGGVPEAQRQRASISRHEAAEHMAALGKERNWKPVILLTAGALAVAITAVVMINRAGGDRRITKALSAGDVRNYETGQSQQVNITLDDGTIALLGPQSKLTVPRLFGSRLRAVKIEGSANFKVGPTPVDGVPFEVRAGDAAVVATGTEFTVRMYPEDSATVVRVREGTVELRLGEEVRSVTQGNNYMVKKGTMSVPSAELVDEASTWVDGHVTIAGRTLRYVLPQLKRYYGLDIKVLDTKLLDRAVFVRAAVNSPREAITSVEQSGGLKFAYVGESMTFSDTLASKGTNTKRR
jgi:ferric-dicitrate binding protein FerR (iron transport regulator)